MMGRFRGPGRRFMRAEIQETWSVYDATRPIRKADMDEAVPPQPGATAPPAAAPEKDGGARTVTLDDPTMVSKLTSATDAPIAQLFGVSEMEVRESRRWAREQADRLGTVTVTGIDTADDKVRH